MGHAFNHRSSKIECGCIVIKDKHTYEVIGAHNICKYSWSQSSKSWRKAGLSGSGSTSRSFNVIHEHSSHARVFSYSFPCWKTLCGFIQQKTVSVTVLNSASSCCWFGHHNSIRSWGLHFVSQCIEGKRSHLSKCPKVLSLHLSERITVYTVLKILKA